ncbi:MAG: DUF1501 domain-containing protein [Candidatus Kapabacteria bacterium]|nr:DUF1501 domain-containing protein [Candidatus Kapabacteria bacterium]
MNRRSFLQKSAIATAAAPTIIGGMPLLASSPSSALGSNFMNNDNIVIIIQLFGGNDGLNTIVPAEDDNYYNLRPGISVVKDTAVRILGSDVFLHPALVENVHNGGMLNLLEQGNLAVIENVGYENPNLSHFRSTDIWLSGINSSNPDVRLDTGWVGRYFERNLTNFPLVIPEDPLAIQIGGSLSMLLKSQSGDMGITLRDPDSFFQKGAGLTPDEDYFDPATNNYQEEFNFIRTIAKQSDVYSQKVKAAFDKGTNVVNYSQGFAQQLRLISRLISGGLKSKVYMCFMGGFDTHVQQQQSDNLGFHPSLLNNLSNGICQFMDDAIQQGFGEKVVGLTISEFGRRPFENGSRGTDHGAASVQFVFGRNVNAAVYGNPPDLENFTNNGDIVYQNDYRRVYVDILESWFEETPETIEQILGAKVNRLGTIKKRVTSVPELIEPVNGTPFDLYPNPSRGNSVCSFLLKHPTNVSLTIYDTRGVAVKKIYNGHLNSGFHTIPLTVANSGSFVAVLEANGYHYTSNFSVTR